jgi:hypothetical protein
MISLSLLVLYSFEGSPLIEAIVHLRSPKCTVLNEQAHTIEHLAHVALCREPFLKERIEGPEPRCQKQRSSAEDPPFPLSFGRAPGASR